ncbi:AraC family transcriptional regulator [Variovorax ginsengisoli]|uniref:AraC-like DNA-binding protein n=1 Tax=Variovorax ginsengisoli TaxID=363844 RepID=A0ABT9S785_9BURK|nr:AraC family transcriptional regulator [Variovorax ginsengisoli]MDP9899192.1 AraC-like DNA-binding protein [Variovorax ginsengisoli]
MSALQGVLIVDAKGGRTEEHHVVSTTDWDEMHAWSDRIYMPYEVSPTGKPQAPDARMYASKIGSSILSRFSYNIPVHIKDWSQKEDLAIVLTTIRGNARHWVDSRKPADTGVGEAFLVDTSRTDYWVDFDPNHLQVNVTLPHQLLASLYERWFGQLPDERLWLQKVRFGGQGSAWIALMEYASRCMAEFPAQMAAGPLGRHVEEAIGVHLLMQWTQSMHGAAAFGPPPQLAPRLVRDAERYIVHNARHAPTVSEVAAAVGASVRALSGAFRRFRGITVQMCLREERLKGVRADLLAAPPEASIKAIAAYWGYCSMGVFSASYKKRFGELPSQTLKAFRRI